MPEIRFDIPAYDLAMNQFVGQVMDGFIALDPLLGQIPRTLSSHHGPIRNVRGPVPLDQESIRVEISTELIADAIRHTNTEEHTTFLTKLAESNIASLTPQFFKGLEEITNATGNVVDVKGRPFSWDYFNDMLEKILIGFDEEGKPMMPTLVMPPELYEQVKGIEPTPEQKARTSAIIARKRAEFNAQKRTRRLSG